jgi:hypothetical protein
MLSSVSKDNSILEAKIHKTFESGQLLDEKNEKYSPDS